jgi:predicted exporter
VSEREETLGRRVVAWMYVGAVAVAGVFGFVLGEIIYGNGGATGPLADGPQPQYGSVGPIAFQLNGPTLALFGIVAVGLLLGVGLAAIVYVSNRAETA